MNFLKNIFANIKKYRFLLSQLVIRDFKVKYKRSVLGVLWSVLYPLLMMMVMAIVFSNVSHNSIISVSLSSILSCSIISRSTDVMK